MNSKLKVTFLGTGTSQGVPVIGCEHPVCKSSDPRDKRLRVSAMVQWQDYTVVIDCGPDFRQQMLREQVTRVDAIFLTHEHSDHTAGIDDIRPYNFMQAAPLPFYAEKRVFEALHQRFAYVFATVDRYPGSPSIAEFVIDKNTPFTVGEKTVIPVEAHHYDLPVLGFRIDDFTYLTDVKTISTEETEKIKGSRVLVVNALRKEQHQSHFKLEEALEFIEIIRPERAYLTHISHRMGFHNETEKTLPENVFLAYDGLRITI